MNFPHEEVDRLAHTYPTPYYVDRVIADLRVIPIGGSIKRRLFAQWAGRIGYEPTPEEYERAGGEAFPPETGGAQ